MQASVTGASVKGLKGCKTLNKDLDPTNPLEGKEERFVLRNSRLSLVMSIETKESHNSLNDALGFYML